MNCALCKEKECYEGKDCFNTAEDIKTKDFDPQILKLIKVASTIEAQYYMKACRLEELMFFCKKMGYKKLGIAFCIGLESEAKTLQKILEKKFCVFSVCCKVGGVEKEFFDLPKMRMHQEIRCEQYEAMCNPIGQAMVLNREKVDLNIILGLCIGHDILFTQKSFAPVTTFVVKDRVLAHNPVGALYSKYYQNKLNRLEFSS